MQFVRIGCKSHILHHRLNARHLTSTVLRSFLALPARGLGTFHRDAALDLCERCFITCCNWNKPCCLSLLKTVLGSCVECIAGVRSTWLRDSSKATRAHSEDQLAPILHARTEGNRSQSDRKIEKSMIENPLTCYSQLLVTLWWENLVKNQRVQL